jgi:fucose 4-O-acetylase-like acetyltransferase
MSVAADIPCPRTGSRDAGLDVARGLAMVLVVFGHALDGAQSAGHSTHALRFAMLMLYSTHVPLFFMVSGLLSLRLCAQPWPMVLKMLGAKIIWPYLLWSFIVLTLLYLLSDHTNTAQQHYQPLSILWHAPAVLWFLYVLGVSTLLLRLFAPLPWYVIGAIGITCLLLPYLFADWPQKSRFVGMFLIGAAVGPVALRIALHPVAILSAVLVMAVTIWLAADRAVWPIADYPSYETVFIPAGFAGPLLVYAISHWMAQITVPNLLAMIGRNTMAIFVTHILLTAGMRIMLVRLGVTDWGLIITLATFAGVLLPLLAAQLASRWGISRALGWR